MNTIVFYALNEDKLFEAYHAVQEVYDRKEEFKWEFLVANADEVVNSESSNADEDVNLKGVNDANEFDPNYVLVLCKGSD
ncbi:hypothetical protein GGI21_005774, partial [Coemansia aciculifera]